MAGDFGQPCQYFCDVRVGSYGSYCTVLFTCNQNHIQLRKPTVCFASNYVLRNFLLSCIMCSCLNTVLTMSWRSAINPLNAELNPICYLLALLAHHFLHDSRIRVKSLTLRPLMSYIYINIYIYIYIYIYMYDISSLRVKSIRSK